MTWFVEHFFAPLGAYKPAGMFTWPHIVAFIVCMLLIRGAFSVSKNIPWKSVIKITRLLAVVLTALELVKIGYNFYYGYTDLDSWLPLSYCSLFIYACWMSGYGKGWLKKVGDAYITIGALAGGVMFLLVPTTSLMRYPIWHFLSCYSLLFHSMMLYLSAMYIGHHCVALDRTNYRYFSFYFLLAAFISVSINSALGTNLMILRDPYNVPLTFIHELQANSQTLYTLLATLCYLFLPALFSGFVGVRIDRYQEKQALEIDHI